MLSLTVIDTVRPVRKGNKPKGYTPTMTVPELKELTSRLVSAASLKDAANILRQTAKRLPKGKGTWSWYMRHLAKSLSKGKPAFKVFAEGNAKLPFYSFSTLPDFTCAGAGACLDWCYSFTAWRYPGAWARQVQNTLFLWHKKSVILKAFFQLPDGVVVRLYVDGDFDSAETVDFWMTLLDSRPSLRAYGYSKSWRLLWEYAKRHTVPANYMLNLSSGEARQGISRERMKTLPFVRGDFIALPVGYRPEGKTGNIGLERYSDPEYHRAVRKAAADAGLGKVFSCPGQCGTCCAGQHACGHERMAGIPVVIGIH